MARSSSRCAGCAAPTDPSRGAAGRALLSVVFAKQFAGLSVDEMKLGAGLADHALIAAARIARLGFLQPMLHVHPGPGTFEDQIAHTFRVSTGNGQQC